MSTDSVSCFIGIGSNMDRPKEQLQIAVNALSEQEQIRVCRSSSVYRSKPWGDVQNQADFSNAVVELETQLTANSLLDVCLSIESVMGRQRDGIHWGPRTIDLDILLYGMTVINAPNLQVPHPHMRHRAFVLQPLIELNPDIKVPGIGRIAQAQIDALNQPLNRDGRLNG